MKQQWLKAVYKTAESFNWCVRVYLTICVHCHGCEYSCVLMFGICFMLKECFWGGVFITYRWSHVRTRTILVLICIRRKVAKDQMTGNPPRLSYFATVSDAMITPILKLKDIFSSAGCLLFSNIFSHTSNCPGAEEYTDYISAERKDSPNECRGYDTKQADGEASVILELWGMRCTPSLPLLPGPLLFRVVAPEGSYLWVK